MQAIEALCEGGNSIIQDLSLGYDFDDINEALTIAAKNCLNLRSLRYGGLETITEATLIVIAEHCHKFTTLAVGWKQPQLTDAALVALGKGCPEFMELNCPIYIPEATAVGLRALAQGCRKFTSVDLHNSSDTEVIAVVVKGSQLTSIVLSNCAALSGAAFQSIGHHCSNLINVDIDCQMTWIGLSALAKGCKELNSVKVLSFNKLSDSLHVITNIEQFPNLQVLFVEDAQTLSDTELEALSLYCPNLGSICFRDCSAITSVGITLLAQNCSGLACLKLHGCPNITDEGVIALAKYCTQLDCIIMSDCTVHTDNALIAPGAEYPDFNRLSLCNCHQISAVGLTALVRGCSNLTILSLNGCTNVTENVLLAVSMHCKELTSLDLHGTTALTDSILSALVEGCPKLSNIRVSEDHNISKDFVQMLEKDRIYVSPNEIV